MLLFMTPLLDRLRDRGWRLTVQRRVVAQVLSGDHVHLTADEVHDRAGALLPEISRATVYNTLTELVAMGEVLEISTDERAKRYDPNVEPGHQHLICDRCGTIRDVHPAGDLLSALPDAERHGYVVRGAVVTYHGLCADCARAAGQ
jgi:Fur family ferric uptake transcriptional regulator